MIRYLVTSYDFDQQRWYYDIVEAESEWAAAEDICNKRPDIIDANAIPLAMFETWIGEQHAKC